MRLTSLALNTIPSSPTSRSPTHALNSLCELMASDLFFFVGKGCQGKF